MDLSSGKLKWSGYIYQDNFSVGPDGVYAGVGGQLKGLSLETGEELWSIGASFHATHPVNLDGYVYSDLWDGVVGKVDAATGEPVWQAVFNTWVNQGPNGGLVVLGDRVYFTRSGVLFALREGHPVGAPYCDGEWQSSYKGDPWLDELDE